MLFETLQQGKEFGVFLLVGFVIGAVLGLMLLFKILCKKNIIVVNIMDFMFSILFILVFFVVLNYVHYGQFRFFLMAGYLLGFIVERKTVGILFAKCYGKLYNKFTKVIVVSKTTRLGKIIFK